MKSQGFLLPSPKLNRVDSPVVVVACFVFFFRGRGRGGEEGGLAEVALTWIYLSNMLYESANLPYTITNLEKS